MSGEPAVDLASIVVRSSEQVSGDIDAQAVLLSIDTGKYYSMNEMGTRIWARIETPVQVDALVEELLAQFDVQRAVCEAEVLAFLARLQTERLLQVQA